MTDPQSIEIRRKRVLYRAQHRGTQEMDILLGGFVAERLDSLDGSMLDRLEKLMDCEETDLQAWLLNQSEPPETVDRALLALIRNARTNKVRQ